MSKERQVPAVEQFGSMGAVAGVRFSFAGNAFLARYRAMLEPTRLTPVHVLALSYVIEHPGCDQNSLAAALCVNKASAMSVVNRLEANGFLQRAIGMDKRHRSLRLTAEGLVAFEGALAVERALSGALFGWMSPDEFDRFLTTIDEVRERASAPLPPRAKT